MEEILYSIDITNLPQEILTANSDISNAIANDGLNDGDAIQAAIDWLSNKGEEGTPSKSIIYLPEGVFDLAETLTVNTPDIKFEGAGAGLTVLQNAEIFQVGTEGLPDSVTNVNSVNRDAYLFDLDRNADNVTFANMTLTGKEVHGAIFGFKADSLEIEEVEFNNFLWSSVRLFNLSDAKIHDNVFIDAGGRAERTRGQTGGSIYATYLKDSEIYNNHLSNSEGREGNVFGIKGRKFTNTHIHHNTINTNFAIELPHENDRLVEIDHNFLNGVVSIPRFGGGVILEDESNFHIHHNYFTKSYSLEWARNSVEIDRNVFNFNTEQDTGNLISNFGSESAFGQTKFHNNLILNPGRGIFWSRGIYNNLSFYNNEIRANKTITPRVEGLFGFNEKTDFDTIEIRDNIIELNEISRPLVRNEASYNAVIENNTLSNISDIDKLNNPDTGAPRGLLEPLLFQVGVNGEFKVEGENIFSAAELIADLRFEDGDGTIATDESPFGRDNSGNLLNGADFTIVEGNPTGVVHFEGNNDRVQIANSEDINLGIHGKRTISLWFRAEETNTTNPKQVLYEEGGGIRGLNIYLDSGQLYVGGWNIPESNWTGTYISTDEISINQWHHVALVLDGGTTVEADSLMAYVDGQQIGQGEGSQLWFHGDAISLGNTGGVTKFHDGVSQGSNGFVGSLDRLQIYNNALNGREVEDLFMSFDE